MRAHHDQVMNRVRDLITRGQADADFRTDLPTDWLITAFYALPTPTPTMSTPAASTPPRPATW